MEPTLLLLVSNTEQHVEKNLIRSVCPFPYRWRIPLMQYSLCLIKFLNPRQEDPPCPNEAICTFSLLSVPFPHSFFPLNWASRLSRSFFSHALQQAIFPSSPTCLPGERTGKQNKRITHWETVICTALLAQTLPLTKVIEEQRHPLRRSQALRPGKAGGWERRL